MHRFEERVGNLRYAGIRTVTIRDGTGTRTYSERVLRQGRNVRIEFGDDSPFAGQYVIETPQERLHVVPATNEVRVLVPRREDTSLFPFRGRLLGGRPRIVEADGGRVAGVATRRLDCFDVQNRPLQKLWIDPVRGAILKREIYDPLGNLSAKFEFTRILYDADIQAQAFDTRQLPGQRVTALDVLKRAARQANLPMALLPPASGFVLDTARVIDLGGNSGILMHLYTSTDARLSVYVLRGQVNRQRLDRLAQGGYRTFVMRRDEYSVVLVGGLVAADLERLARSLRLEQP